MSDEESHIYTDRTTGFTVRKRWRLMSALTGAYYKLYDSKGDYVRSFESKDDAIYAAKVGKK
jgi:hypothetical protein